MYQHLTNLWNNHNLHHTYIISSNIIENSLENLQKLALNILGSDLALENHPDFKIIRRYQGLKNDNKYINIDQIRELQKFLYNTAAVGENKVVIIYEADLMNLNAANCCLKLLEEPPKNSFMFLLTSRPHAILPTILSRSMKYNDVYKEFYFIPEGYDSYHATLNSSSYVEKIQYINSLKFPQDWENFCNCVLYHLRDTKDYKIYEKISKIISNTNNFDLDKKNSTILILESF
jgi:DNA polymerase-3 subunit delta'